MYPSYQVSGKYILGVAQTKYINIPKYIEVIYSLLESILIKKYTDIFRSKVASRAKLFFNQVFKMKPLLTLPSFILSTQVTRKSHCPYLLLGDVQDPAPVTVCSIRTLAQPHGCHVLSSVLPSCPSSNSLL